MLEAAKRYHRLQLLPGMFPHLTRTEHCHYYYYYYYYYVVIWALKCKEKKSNDRKYVRKLSMMDYVTPVELITLWFIFPGTLLDTWLIKKEWLATSGKVTL